MSADSRKRRTCESVDCGRPTLCTPAEDGGMCCRCKNRYWREFGPYRFAHELVDCEDCWVDDLENHLEETEAIRVDDIASREAYEDSLNDACDFCGAFAPCDCLVSRRVDYDPDDAQPFVLAGVK